MDNSLSKLVLISALMLAACAPNMAYRTNAPPADGVCSGTPQSCGDQYWQRLGVQPNETGPTPTNPVHLGYVEFDDQGALFDPDRKRRMMDRIEAIGAEHPLLLVVFVHGWKHNASADDGNAASFARALRRIAAMDESLCAGAPCERRRVVGVYVGWRGLSLKLPGLKNLTFWTRKSRAHRVGTDGVTEVLNELKLIENSSQKAELARLDAAHLPHSRRDELSRMVVTGHSFGSAVVFTALQQQIMRDTVFRNQGSVQRSAADLVVLINPAFEAARVDALQRRLREWDHGKTQRPVLAVFTSEEDVATRTAFPMGRTLGTFTHSYASDEQRAKDRTTVGHYRPFITHELRLRDAQISELAPLQLSSYNDFRCSWRDFQRTDEVDIWDLGDILLERDKSIQTKSQRRNPFYNVRVKPEIIQDHNDIWGDRFGEFLYRFVAVQSASLSNCPQNRSASTGTDGK